MSHSSNIIPFVTIGMEREAFRQEEAIRPRRTHTLQPHSQAESENKNKQKATELTDTEKRSVVARGWGKGWAKWVRVVKRCSSGYKIIKSWGCNVTIVNNKYCIASLQVAETVDLKVLITRKNICNCVVMDVN